MNEIKIQVKGLQHGLIISLNIVAWIIMVIYVIGERFKTSKVRKAYDTYLVSNTYVKCKSSSLSNNFKTVRYVIDPKFSR